MNKIKITKAENGFTLEFGNSLKVAKDKNELALLLADIFIVSINQINAKEFEFNVESKIL